MSAQMPSRRNTSAGRPRSSALNTATRAANRSSGGHFINAADDVPRERKSTHSTIPTRSRLFVFGFSQCAYTARTLAGILNLES